MLIGTILALIVSPGPAAIDVSPLAAKATSSDLAQLCANEPGLFKIRRLSVQEVNSLLPFSSSEDVKNEGPTASFEVSGPCTKVIAHMLPLMRLTNGRWLIESEPPLELIATNEIDTAPTYNDGPVAQVSQVYRFLSSVTGGERLVLRSIVEIANERYIGLWTNRRESIVASMKCKSLASCTAPQKMVGIPSVIKELGFQALPERPGQGVLSLWLPGARQIDDLLSVHLSFDYTTP